MKLVWPIIRKSKRESRSNRGHRLELLNKPSEASRNLQRFSNLDIFMPILNSTRGKEHLRDWVAEKWTFLVLVVVGNVDVKVG